jgi:hypothetical protein
MTVTLVNGIWLAYRTLEGLTGIGLSPYLAIVDYFEAVKTWGKRA